jgi:hypothetical protein
LSIESLRHSMLATLFMAIAGFVDSVGFLKLSGLFASFKSGNSTQFALHLGQEFWAAALRPGAVGGLFVVGVVLGRLASAVGSWGRPHLRDRNARHLGRTVRRRPSRRGIVLSLPLGRFPVARSRLRRGRGRSFICRIRRTVSRRSCGRCPTSCGGRCRRDTPRTEPVRVVSKPPLPQKAAEGSDLHRP